MRRILLALLVFATIGCDRVTKHLATTSLAGGVEQSYLGDTIRVAYAENPGGFLSLGARLPASIRRVAFTVGPALALGLLGWLAYRQRWRGAALVGAALFLAGGASNWIDRVGNGHVVDFLNVGIGPVRTGIFNVADMAIMAGAVLIAAGMTRRVPDRPPVERQPGSPNATHV